MSDSDYRLAFLERQKETPEVKVPEIKSAAKHSFDPNTDISPREFELFGGYGTERKGS